MQGKLNSNVYEIIEKRLNKQMELKVTNFPRKRTFKIVVGRIRSFVS